MTTGCIAHARDAVRTVDVVYFSCNGSIPLVGKWRRLATMSNLSGLPESVVPSDDRRPHHARCPQAGAPLMRRIALVVAVLTSLVLASTASAEQMNRSGSQASAARKGPVAKLIELERRKNAWLREKMGR